MQGALASSLVAACTRFEIAKALSGVPDPTSYGELHAQARALAAQLRQTGLAPHEPVHVLVSNQPADVAALFAVWLAGGVAVPVHRTTPSSVAAAFHVKTQSRWQVDLVDPAQPAAAITAIQDAPPPARPLLDGAALIIFTSGSTGTPKGVVVSHDAFLGKIEQIDSLLRFGSDDRTLLVLNITFSFGLWVTLLTLLSGARLTMLPKFEAETFLDTLADRRITRVGMVPTMMRVLFSQPELNVAIDRIASQGDLRQILIGGESLGLSLAQSIRERFSRTELVDIYGLTETATCDFFSFPAQFARYPGAIGSPSPNVRYRIVGEGGVQVDAAQTGELQILSPYLMKGYLDDPELTAAGYEGPWFRTGDLAREVDSSVVELMGRSKELISRGGNKVTPLEIEAALTAHPAVAAAMAVGVPDAVLGERIHVLVVPQVGQSLHAEALRGHLQPRLERFKQPDVFHIASALPLGRTGKADRSALKTEIMHGRIPTLKD